MQCFLWSTLPSAKKLSNGELDVFIYECVSHRTAVLSRLTSLAKHKVDGYIKEIGLPAVLVLTGTFYENMIYRKHATYLKETDSIEFRHPVIEGDTKRES